MLALVAVEASARVVASRLDPVHDWPRHDYVLHEAGLAARSDDVRLLVVGSSIAGRAISPDGLAAAGGPGPGYNFWLAGPPMRSINLLTSEVLLERVDPSVVVIGVSMREFQDGPAARDHVEALEQAPAFRVATDRSTLIDLVDDQFRELSATARHRQTLRDPSALIAQLRSPAPVAERLAPDGFLAERGENQLADEPAAHIAQEQEAMAGFQVSQSDLDALAELLDELGDRDVDTLVVNLPVSDRFIALGGDGGYDTYLGAVESISSDRGSVFLDAMTATTWSDADFGDMNHLNDRGTQRLQPHILDALDELDA